MPYITIIEKNRKIEVITCTNIGQFKTYCMNVVLNMSYGVLCIFFTFPFEVSWY